MKRNIVITALAICSLASSNAASISVVNLVGGGPDPLFFTTFVDVDGTSRLDIGIFALGTFIVEPPTAADILGNFSQAGTFTFGTANFSDTVVTDPLTAGDGFVGSTVYAVVGNGTTLANSTGLAVWKATSNDAGNTFTADNPVGGPDLVTILDTKGDLIVGSLLPTYDAGFGIGQRPAFQLAAIPEPSTLLLSALGILALLRRKR